MRELSASSFSCTTCFEKRVYVMLHFNSTKNLRILNDCSNVEHATLENESSNEKKKRRGNEKYVVIAFKEMIFKVKKNIVFFTSKFRGTDRENGEKRFCCYGTTVSTFKEERDHNFH